MINNLINNKEINVQSQKPITIQPLKPKTRNQAQYLDLIKKKKLVICVGPAGSGKSSLCSRYGIAEVLKENFDKIIITRPMVQAGEETGFLPGNIQEKLNPYLVPIFDEFKISGLSCEDIRKLIYENKIEICPIAYARGRNWHNSFIVLDETSNCTYEQLILIMTRLGRNSKLIINGDPLQSDLPKNKRVDLKKFGEFLAEIEDVGFVELNNEDIIREEIVSEILKKVS